MPLYLEPCGFSYGTGAPHAVALAGSSFVFFSSVILHERDATRARISHPPLSLANASSYIHQHFGKEGGDYAEICLTRLQEKHHFSFLHDGNEPSLMGIVNVTPDSFSDGGLYHDTDAAVAHGLSLQEQGSAVIDVGGESTRPYATPVAPTDEIARVKPVIAALAAQGSVPISIDSRHSETMKQAVAAGATIINDVSGLTHDPQSIPFCQSHQLPIIIMHMGDDPTTMQDNPHYDDALLDIYDFLANRITILKNEGIDASRLIIDPGIGFGKNKEHNRALLTHIALFHTLGCPLLIGVSRKRFIDDCAPHNDPQQRLAGSAVAAVMMAARGVSLLRVHDVAQTKQALAVWRTLVTN